MATGYKGHVDDIVAQDAQVLNSGCMEIIIDELTLLL